jgi:hypothetical protein
MSVTIAEAGSTERITFNDEQKYWAVVWMTRALKGLRRSYRNTRPMFVEVF